MNIRDQFPSLKRKINGKSVVYLDGPAGTQVPQRVIDAISDYYKTSNANTHGQFASSHETDQMIQEVRNKLAVFLGAESADCISFGQNMTTLNYSLSRAIGRVLQPGDEILITQLDHEANRGPWLALRENGVVVREVRMQPNGTLDYDDMANKLNERTRLVAMGYASNLFGTVNEVEKVRDMTYQNGSWLLLDAVHAAPHMTMDVGAVDCDFLLCSAYKFYGPHVGILYARPGLLDSLPTDRLRTQEQHAPYSIETGTLNHAAITGVGAAIDFIASLGNGPNLSAHLLTGMAFIHHHEKELFHRLVSGLLNVRQVKIYGPSYDTWPRCPTVSFSVESSTASRVCRTLANEGIFAWDGHFYAIRATEVLGQIMFGGFVRMGLAAYSNLEDVERTIEVMKKNYD
ncbi:MAG: cysteine desulfurase-like protein [Saprospirales bacterium]|nr:cysteine desulfurase-like protein [Saprospirales bacterium]